MKIGENILVRRTLALSAVLLILQVLRFGGPAGLQIFGLSVFLIVPILQWEPYLKLRGGESWIICLGLILGLNIVVILTGIILAGADVPLFLSLWWLVIGFVAPLCALAIPFQFQRTTSVFRPNQVFENRRILFGLVLLIAVCLRLPWLGYKEFQGDEGIVLYRAAEVVVGYGETLFLHQKGPAEIILPAALWGISGTTSEFWVRLPFLLCNITSIVALMAVAKRWFNLRAALFAGLGLGIMGFHVAFGRIVQYQSIVVLMGTLALLSATIYMEDKRSFFLPLASFFLAVGLLAHYDAVLFLPAIMGLILYDAFKNRRFPFPLWGMTILAGLLPLLIFYLPFFLNPNFGDTFSYLLNDRVGTERGGSLSDVWRMVTFYNSSYYVLGLGGFFLGGLILNGRSWGGSSRNIAAFLLALVPLLFYTLVVTDPRTHVYMFFPGIILVASYGVDQALTYLNDTQRMFGLAALGLWFAICALYPYLMFTDGPAERQRNWETARPMGYWTTWSDPPEFGLFGFPYRAGWRIVGPMVAEAAIHGAVYGSNEEMEVTGWYTAQSVRTHCGDFDRFVLVEQVQDEQPFDADRVLAFEPQLIGLENGAQKIALLSPTDRDPIEFQVGAGQLWRRPEEVARPRSGGSRSIEAQYGDAARLVGYDLDLKAARPGGSTTVTLYWQGLRPFERNFQVFVQLYDPVSGEVVGQYDTAPDCAVQPTTRWEPGQVVRDPHPIPLRADLPSDIELQVLVGMYDLLTFERLPMNGDPGGALHLADIVLD